MKNKKKGIVAALIGLVGFAGVFAAAPSYAYGHYPYHPYHPHYYHHGGGNGLAAGIIFGAAAGMIAVAAMSQNQGYYQNCQRVYYNRYCHYNYWGDRFCRVVRHVEYVC